MPAIGDKVPDATVMITAADGPGRASGQEFLMIADPDAAFARAVGRDTDAGSFGLGIRSERYAAIIRDDVITSLDVEERFVDHEVSTAEAVLARL